MEREELDELHYIAHIDNVSSIHQRGLLSHNRARSIPHKSVAMMEIQERRSKKIVPGSRPLHDYVNLYINARNPMLYKRRSEHSNLCVLRVSPEVLDLPGVVVVDRNAARDWAAFYPALDGLKYIGADLVFAESWIHPNDPVETHRHAGIMCAEVLVPDCVDFEYILGAYVSHTDVQDKLSGDQGYLELDVNRHLFFL